MSVLPNLSNAPQNDDGSNGAGPGLAVAASTTMRPGDLARAAFGDEGVRIAEALAEAVIPGGDRIPQADIRSVDRLARLLAPGGRWTQRGFAALLSLLEHASILRTGRRFTQLDRRRRAEMLWEWHKADGWRRAAFVGLTYPLKNAHFDSLETYQAMGCVWENPPVTPEPPPRWRQQVVSARDLSQGETLECDVVVVGTGAGGAVLAKELAEQGVAVLMVEEGEYFERKDFVRRSMPGTQMLYRHGGINGVVGNCVIPIPLGKTVGGSTTINTGTCLRTPDWILERWRQDLGMHQFTPDHMAPFFDKVEGTLEVGPNERKYLGPPADVVARGCEALGWSHFPVPRNAPGCDGQGVCNWGCPTDAKKSMNISYVPLALKRGAQLITGMRVERVLIEGGRAVGVTGRATRDGRAINVRSRGVVLACGAMATPVMLASQGIANGSGQVGRNLSIHPATGVGAIFDESIRGFEHVPQGYGIDELHRDGILILGAGAPLDMGANMFQFVGDRYTRVMEQYDRIATFGVMVEDEANGRIVPGPRGMPIGLYHLGKRERRLLARGAGAVARVFFAAGARACFTEIHGFEELRSLADVARLEGSTPGGFDIVMTAFHPLGTCRMGSDPLRSVVDASHESWDVPGLYIVDGSAVPTSLAVNPQLTIMALATRAAGLLAPRFVD